MGYLDKINVEFTKSNYVREVGTVTDENVNRVCASRDRITAIKPRILDCGIELNLKLCAVNYLVTQDDEASEEGMEDEARD